MHRVLIDPIESQIHSNLRNYHPYRVTVCYYDPIESGSPGPAPSQLGWNPNWIGSQLIESALVWECETSRKPSRRRRRRRRSRLRRRRRSRLRRRPRSWTRCHFLQEWAHLLQCAPRASPSLKAIPCSYPTRARLWRIACLFGKDGKKLHCYSQELFLR
ncbi:hypothetical protein BHE74_00027715 [Ensete ventricosum]|nr:hypothetical protein BHE74_00027715 [Ensete ventricosum]